MKVLREMKKEKEEGRKANGKKKNTLYLGKEALSPLLFNMVLEIFP